MLGTKTKQVFSYGRRRHRVVNVSEDNYETKEEAHLPRAKLLTDLNNKPENALASPRIPGIKRKQQILSPVSSHQLPPQSFRKKTTSKAPYKSPKATRAAHLAPARKPLALFSPNAPDSPAVPLALRQKRRQPVVKSSPFKSSSPIVNVDIVVLDHKGRTLKQERRVSRSNVQVNQAKFVPMKSENTTTRPRASDSQQIEIYDSEDNMSVPPKPVRRTSNSTTTMPGVFGSNPIEISDSEDDVYVPPKPAKRASKRIRQNVVYSSDEESDPAPSLRLPVQPEAPPALPAPIRQRNTIDALVRSIPGTQSPPRTRIHIPKVSISNPTVAMTGQSSLRTRIEPSKRSPPISRPMSRQLTPVRIRQGRSSIFPAPPSPPSPSTPTNVDLSLEFEGLDLSPTTLREINTELRAIEPPPPEYLRALLEECSQKTPHEFSAFIDMFPFDPIVQTTHGGVRVGGGKAQFQKIGEASYSEVFGIGDVVLKVIPLRGEGAAGTLADDDIDSPMLSDASDVLKEIIVTGDLGDMCAGFVKLLRAYIVRGKYPSLLLDLWDEYHEKKGSEGVRPDTFTVSQLYAIIMLPNGGPDLEAYSFRTPSKTGWRQACSVFWQVTRALAQAEELVRFEHRDLHWGQILVRNFSAQQLRRSAGGKRLPMDHDCHGVKATIIDLGLARMDAHEDTNEGVRWTPFEEEIFEGEGEYQFDVYRMMRVHNGDSWQEFRPLTNVMWLHYLSLKLLQSKHLRPPSATRRNNGVSASSAFTEQECYQCLVEIERALANAIASCKPKLVGKRGMRTTHAPSRIAAVLTGPVSASAVLQMAIEREWLE